MQFLIVERFLKKSESYGEIAIERAQCGCWLYFAVRKEFLETLKFCSPWPNVLIVDGSTQTAACNLVHFCCSDLKMEQIQLLNVGKEFPLLLLCSLLFSFGIYLSSPISAESAHKSKSWLSVSVQHWLLIWRCQFLWSLMANWLQSFSFHL